MANSIFGLFSNNPAPQSQYPQQRNGFLEFANQVRQTGVSPEQTVRQLINSGRMSQDQFNQLSQIANQIMGRKA